jgi:hypothetical protein
MKKISLLLFLVFASASVNAQSWQYTASMSSAHWDAGMIALDNQTAMVVGGFDAQMNAISTCEIYDPSTATWSGTGNLNIGRAYPCMIKLSNGHVLAISGATSINGTASDVVEEYDPATGTWQITGHLLMRRMVPTANLLDNGKILIAGGYNGSSTTSSCELYDPQTNTSAMTGSTHVNFYEHQSTKLADGRVMVNGGRDGGAGSNYFNGAELYDPATGTWTPVSSMVQSRMEAITATFSDGAVLAAGGRNSPTSSAPGSEIFDANTLTWSNTDPLKEPVCWMGCIQFPDDRYMVTGGIITGTWIDALGLDNVTTPKCEWYDRANRLWYYAPELNLSRCRHKAMYLHQTGNVDLPTDFLLVAGGQTGVGNIDSDGNLTHFTATFTNTVEILDVTLPALKAYMKMAANQTADVAFAGNTDSKFKIYYANSSIKVEYTIDANENTGVEILNISGQQIKQLPAQNLSAGEHTLNIPVSDLSSGMYFLRVSTSSGIKNFKFFVAK